MRSALKLVVAMVVLPLVAVVCGLGWLYLLRSHHLLAVGPPVKGALALQQLALADGQPLARTLAAWLVAGASAGALLCAAGSRGTALLPAFAAGSAVWLVVAGAASDALANNLRVADQLSAQLSSSAVVVALAALVPAAAAGLLAARAAVRS